MQHPAGGQIHHQRQVLAFLAEIDFVDGDSADIFEVKRSVLPLQMLLVDRFDRVPTQARQGRHILDRSDVAQVNDEALQRTAVMLLRLGKNQAGLSDGPTAFALQARNRYNQFDLTQPYRQQLEATLPAPESDHSARLTGTTLELVGMQVTVKNGLALNKTARLY